MMAAIVWSGLALGSCTDNDDNPGMPEDPTPGESATNIDEPSDFAAYMDQSVYCGDDFYNYAVGKWRRLNPLQPDEETNGTQAEQSKMTEAFIESLSTEELYRKRSDKDAVLDRLRLDYRDDELAADKAELQKIIGSIEAVGSKEEMYQKMAELIRDGYQAPFGYVVDAFHRRVMPKTLMPESRHEFVINGKVLMDYAAMTPADTLSAMTALKKWTDKLTELEILEAEDGSGNEDADRDNLIFHHDKQRRLNKRLRVMTRGQRRAMSSNPMVNICQMVGFETEELATDKDALALGDRLASLSLAELKNLAKYFVVNRDYNFMPREAPMGGPLVSVDEFITTLAKQSHSPMATRLSALFNKQVPEANRDAVLKMCEEFREAMRERISNRPWMSNATKAKAIEKLEAMLLFVGWPDTQDEGWQVKVPEKTGTTAYQVVCDLYRQRTAIVDRMQGRTSEADLYYASEFENPSYTDNAFYASANNSIYILSSNLVPPIYDPSKGDAYNYAQIGASTIGHEISHGFDSNGSKYGKHGEMENWWGPEDATAFEALQQQMIDRFNGLTYWPSQKCNGEKTLGENIADLAGLYIGYDVLMRRLERQNLTAAETDRQGREFFRAFAFAWMENYNEEKAEAYTKDVHAPACLRVNGNVYLMDEFYRLFDIRSGKMYVAPDERIEIW